MDRTSTAAIEPPEGAVPDLPHGTLVWPLVVHGDVRGCVAEYFRAEWVTDGPAVQWAMVRTRPHAFRGIHVHPRHDDYVVLVEGAATLGLCDLRPGSPTERRSALVALRADAPAMVRIPHGVAHGFLFSEPSWFVLGSNRYYDPADELGCHWRDPALGLAWPAHAATLSPRDAALPPLAALNGRIAPWRP
jgi:dTDP-4-dehydrorhamnose 3,5-epimerase